MHSVVLVLRRVLRRNASRVVAGAEVARLRVVMVGVRPSPRGPMRTVPDRDTRQFDSPDGVNRLNGLDGPCLLDARWLRHPGDPGDG